jgi:Fe-S cluster biogenesis protein NfuA
MSSIESLLDEFRAPFRADGGDIAVVRQTADELDLRILVGPTACRDCIMPPETVKSILESTIKQQLGRVIRVGVEIADADFGALTN